MADLSSRPLAEVQRRVAEVHHQRDLQQQLRFYNGWAKDYDQVTSSVVLLKAFILLSMYRPRLPWYQLLTGFHCCLPRHWLGCGLDVAVLQYQAPSLAAAFLASIFQGSPENALVLDVACGTGLVAQELQAKGFRHFHGLDGSQEMLEHARHKGLYEDLKLCLLGQETLPAPEDSYDTTVIVGALSEGQVPSGVIPQLLLVTKPGGYVCLTTRSNSSNLQYNMELQQLLNDLEQQGLWEKVGMQEVEKWERATSHQESDQGSGYISGVVYIYRKKIKSLV